MGFFDRAKAALGLGRPSTEAQEGPGAEDRGRRGPGARQKDGRPPLRDIAPASSGGSLDDALAAREAGRPEEARKILASLDRGKGLRTVLRAAAALEAGDEEELAQLLPAIKAADPAWTLPLQIASAMDKATEGQGTGESRAALVALARAHGAPAWALAWTRASSPDEVERRHGMVDLLFADAALARTVAARDWKVDGAVDDREAVERYASFAHGRDAVRRFGVERVALVLAKARGAGS